MFALLSYSAEPFSCMKGILSKMDVHWCTVQRWVTNCFRLSLVPILSAESCLPPLSVHLSHKRRIASIRLISSPTTISPASARLCRSFPSWHESRASNPHRALHPCLAANAMPLDCKTALLSPLVCPHHPVDALEHFNIALVKDPLFTQLMNSALFPDLSSLPSD